MGFPNLTMDHRGGHKSIKPPSSPASSKFSPSSYANRPSFKQKTDLPLNLKHFPRNTLSNKTQPDFLNISRPTKHHKMPTSSSASSKKRARDDEPFNTGPLYPISTELEDFLKIPTKKPCLAISRPEIDVYSRRQRVAKYAAMIRKKRALVETPRDLLLKPD